MDTLSSAHFGNLALLEQKRTQHEHFVSRVV